MECCFRLRLAFSDQSHFHLKMLHGNCYFKWILVYLPHYHFTLKLTPLSIKRVRLLLFFCLRGRGEAGGGWKGLPANTPSPSMVDIPAISVSSSHVLDHITQMMFFEGLPSPKPSFQVSGPNTNSHPKMNEHQPAKKSHPGITTLKGPLSTSLDSLLKGHLASELHRRRSLSAHPKSHSSSGKLLWLNIEQNFTASASSSNPLLRA